LKKEDNPNSYNMQVRIMTLAILFKDHEEPEKLVSISSTYKDKACAKTIFDNAKANVYRYV